MRAALTLKSRNAKTGPIPVSTSSADTCPDACPLKGAGCYAQGGPLGIFWRKVTEGATGYGQDWDSFLGEVEHIAPRQLWRHNQAGDLPGDGRVIDLAALAALVRANGGSRGFTYTHYDVTGSSAAALANRAAVAFANASGFTVNLSADNLAEADALADTGAGPVVTVLPYGLHSLFRSKAPAHRGRVFGLGRCGSRHHHEGARRDPRRLHRARV